MKGDEKNLSRKLNNQELFHFCDQMEMILRSGISTAEGIQLIYEDTADEASRELWGILNRRLDETGSLAEALIAGDAFPDNLIEYVKIGEETGRMEEVMGSLADHYEQEIALSLQIRSAITYPLIMLGMMFAVIGILLVKVLPVFRQVFAQLGLELTGLAKSLSDIGRFFTRYSLILLGFLFLMIILILLLGLHPAGKKMLRRMTSHFPIVRQIPVMMDYSRFSLAISLGLKSGLDAERSLTMSQSLVSHPLVRERLQTAVRHLEEGEIFSAALLKAGLFGGMDAKVIQIASQTGDMDTVMQRIASRYQEESASRIEELVSVIEPMIVILLSALVGMVLLSVMIPMLGILSEMMV